MTETTVRRRSTARILGLILLYLGILLGAVYAAVAAWGDWEALQFGTMVAFRSEDTLSTLRCPVLMTTGESAPISVLVKNPLQREITRTVRVYISAGDILAKREFMERVRLGPGESRRLSWEIFPQDRVFDRFVLVRVYLARGFFLPSADASCGVMVVNLPSWRGNVIVFSVLAISLLGMGSGVFLVRKGLHGASMRVRELARNGTAMAALVVLSIPVGLLGWLWAESIVLLLIFLLAIITAATVLAFH